MDELRKYIHDLIKTITGLPVCFYRANDNLDLPYVVFSLTDWSPSDFVRKQYSLTVDVYCLNSPKKAIEVTDKLNEAFKAYKDNTDDFMIAIYIDTGSGFVDDTDKNLYRLTSGYEVVTITK